MTAQEKARWFIAHPAALGRALGYTDFRDDLHGGWIKRMVTSEDDMTLQAHRGSYKTTCLCVAISLLMLWHPDQNIIFLRKTDGDVAEVIKTVNRILSTDIMRDIYNALTGGKAVEVPVEAKTEDDEAAKIKEQIQRIKADLMH